MDISAVAETSKTEEIQRKLTPEETTTLKSIAGKLTWVAVYKSPLYAFNSTTSL